MEIIQYKNCKFEKNQLILAEDLTKEEWINIGSGLKLVEGSVQMWIGDWARFGQKKGFYTDTKTYKEIADITGYKPKSIKEFKYVADNIPSSIRMDDISFGHLQQIAPLSSEKQIEFIEKIKEDGLTVKELKNEIRKDTKVYIVKPIPFGTYNLVYCDPPWQYTPAEITRQVENHYPTMSDEEIYKMDLPELSFDCLLLIWATVGKLPTALKTIEAWGFTYKSHCVWDKEIIGMGYWFRGQHELLLVATRGNFSPPEVEDRISSMYKEKRTEHSKKPDFYYDWIEKSFPNTKKIELFSRNKREGWEAWGNE